MHKIPHYAFKHISKTVSGSVAGSPKTERECGGPDGLTKAKKKKKKKHRKERKPPENGGRKDRYTGKIARGEKEETSVGEGESDFSR